MKDVVVPALADRHAVVRVLGLDPGLTVTGYGVLEFSPEGLALIEAGVIRPPRTGSLEQRLVVLSDGIVDVLQTLAPTCVALERLFAHADRPLSAILMGHARGVLCLACGRANVPITEYAPTEVKRLLTGSGKAGKPQMQAAVRQQLELDELPEPPDVADALALALCHGFRIGLGTTLRRRSG